ncbi:unnamed protein product [Discosporangium mesarthrocarpum]
MQSNVNKENIPNMESFKIKTNYKGSKLALEIPNPPTMDGLKKAFVQAYGLEDTEKLNFTYKDDQDNVRFDTTEELVLALRTCRGHLRVRASVAAEDNQDVKDERTTEDTERGVYATAAGRLAATNDLDVTPEQLEQVMGLLRIPPRRLHKRGLVDSLSGSGTEDIAEEPAGAEENEEVMDKPGHGRTQQEARQQRKGVAIHSVLVDHGVRLRPRDVQPLLRALGVGPRRFVRVGLIDPSEFGRGGRGQHGGVMKKAHGYMSGGGPRYHGHEECDRVGRGGRSGHDLPHNGYHPKHASFRGGKEEGVGFFHPGPHPHHQGPCSHPGAWGHDNNRREKEGSGKDRKWRQRGCGRFEHLHGGMGRKIRQDHCFAPHPHMPFCGHV